MIGMFRSFLNSFIKLLAPLSTTTNEERSEGVIGMFRSFLNSLLSLNYPIVT